MDVCDIKKWNRTKEIAHECGVKITLKSSIELTDKKGRGLGCLGTVDEAFAFLCGYEHSVSLRARENEKPT